MWLRRERNWWTELETSLIYTSTDRKAHATALYQSIQCAGGDNDDPT